VTDGAEPDLDWFGHPLRPERSAPPPGSRRDLPALGRDGRTPRQRRLRQVPLLLVLAVNVAVAVGLLAAIDAMDLAWWEQIQEQSWDQFVLVPLLWPTIAFLALRGLD